MRRSVAARIGVVACVLAVGAGLGLGCQKERWDVGESVRAPDADVAAALGDTSHQNVEGISPQDIPRIDYPRALRPCCAFGADLKVAAGSVPVPGVEIGNLIDPSEVGPHRYDNGYLSLSASDTRGVVDLENNGLVYTCRGGFIDLAHVRDNADNTLALIAGIAREMETGGSADLPPQGAAIRVRTKPISAEAIARYGRITLATALAEWMAFQLSIWHEIATFYGYASLAAWPEKISAFSPEDLYSNEIGARLSGAIVLSRGARTDQEYALNMDAWIRATLKRLHAVSLADARTAMREVDGLWWDSSKRIPDWTLVKRRNFGIGPRLHAWRLEDATPPVAPLPACRKAGPPLVLDVPDGFHGAAFRDYGTVEFEVGDDLVKAGFPLRPDGSRIVNQDDFPRIIARIEAANAETFGPGADHP